MHKKVLILLPWKRNILALFGLTVALDSGAPLRNCFHLTEPHRRHHSTDRRESNSNFGKVLSVWVLVFGTFYVPKGKEVGEVGVKNSAVPAWFVKAVVVSVPAGAAIIHRLYFNSGDRGIWKGRYRILNNKILLVT